MLIHWQLLVLLIIANGAPIVARDLLGDRLALPLDGGREFLDGRPLFGHSKTWRGLISAVIATASCAQLLGLDVISGLYLGALAMLGDVISSFIKRRFAIAPSGRAPLLDQLPEALLPLIVLGPALGLDASAIIATALVFTAVDLLLSPLFYRLRIRKRPY